jgi:hypothetical protein
MLESKYLFIHLYIHTSFEEVVHSQGCNVEINERTHRSYRRAESLYSVAALDGPNYRSEIRLVLNAICVSSVSNELDLVISDINRFLFFPSSSSK